MPQPDSNDVYVNALLTNMSIGYSNLEYVADRIAPPLPVEQQSGIIPKYDRGDWLRSQAVARAPGTIANRSGWRTDLTATYFATNYALGKGIPREVALNARAPFDMDRDATRFVTEQLMLRREKLFAANMMATGKWGTDKTGTTDFVKWSDYAGSDPINDIRDGRRTIRQATGKPANVAACGEIVFDALQDHPDILDRIKGAASPGNPAIVTEGLLAALFRLEDFVVASAIEVTSVEAQTVVAADVIDDDMLLVYRPRTASLFEPSGGYGIYWRPAIGGGMQFIRQYAEGPQMQTVVEGHTYVDYKITSSVSGYFFADAVD